MIEEVQFYPCRDVYEEGMALLAGLEDAALDARLLLEHFCGIDTNRLLAEPGMPVSDDLRSAFLKGIKRRAAREPLAYIVGEQSFMGLPFIVSEDVLIPEQDTENLVEEALRLIDDGSRILDLCTGSGCILLSLLHYTNGCIGVGTDLSEKALEIARRNASAHGLSDQTVWLQGDLFDALDPLNKKDNDDKDNKREKYKKEDNKREEIRDDQAEKSTESEKSESGFPGMSYTSGYDMIISNPPYIPTSVIDTLQPEVRCAQPRMALDGGGDGLDFYRRIIREAPAHLVVGGRLLLEIGYDQAEAVSDLLREAGYYGIEILKDYGGNDRIATAVCSLAQKRN
ncbi:release factor glutamine methyltransferase [Sarcina sp. DSM 11001]|uniref:N5-glutamine methyltransferase family protein n=1 Tax=Sarcina sp. DSM 11001 TaxID=1798184 RepID=UPI00087F0925|nr:HemK/PrmC family methyltransferase [Sarcina sp. DSM 11001]SDK30817.1 release factor glutamine methyltransferase [Sarcina sp. DSM 11001]